MDSGGDVIRDSRIYMMASVAAAAALALAGCAESSEPGQLVSSAEESTPHDGTTTDTSATGELFGLNPVGIGEKVDAASGSYMQSTEPGPVPPLSGELLQGLQQSQPPWADGYSDDEAQAANVALVDFIAAEVTDSRALVPSEADCDAWLAEWGKALSVGGVTDLRSSCSEWGLPQGVTLPAGTKFLDVGGVRVASRTITPTQVSWTEYQPTTPDPEYDRSALKMDYDVSVVYRTKSIVLRKGDAPVRDTPTRVDGTVVAVVVPDSSSPTGHHMSIVWQTKSMEQTG